MSHMNQEVINFIKLVNKHMQDVTVSSARPSEVEWFNALKEKIKESFDKSDLLGSGYLSAAYQHPTDPTKVIKVGFKREDSGAAYAAFCRQHQGEYGVPQIDWMERFEKVYFVIMKKYSNYSKGIKIQRDRNLRHSIDRKAEIESVYETTYSILNGHSGGRHLKKGHKIFDFADKVYSFFNGLASFDLHSDNIMYDEELDQMIITDPVSFGNNRNSDKVKELEDRLGLKAVSMDKLGGLQPAKIIHDEIQLNSIGIRGMRAGMRGLDVALHNDIADMARLVGMEPQKARKPKFKLQGLDKKFFQVNPNVKIDWGEICLPLHKPMLSKLIAHRPNHRELAEMANNCIGFERDRLIKPRELNIFKHGIELKPRMMNIKCNIA